jgi:NAD(P)-dependent dehydrogenase (short-subunit alcohol dehydrogenase family)
MTLMLGRSRFAGRNFKEDSGMVGAIYYHESEWGVSRSGGLIVNVSSVATRGVNAIPACLAFEYSEHGIRACGVAPGASRS